MFQLLSDMLFLQIYHATPTPLPHGHLRCILKPILRISLITHMCVGHGIYKYNKSIGQPISEHVRFARGSRRQDCGRIKREKMSDLLKMSFSSCSDTNWPRFATKRVEHCALLTAMFGCDEGDPTGDASAGDGKK